MFSGIVQGMGRVVSVADTKGGVRRLRVQFPEREVHRSIGQSVAIDGVCLTVTSSQGNACDFDVMGETLKRTTLGLLREGDLVNYESAVKLDSGLDGHLVQGHIDGVGEVASIREQGDWRYVRISTGSGLLRYVAEKGSIAIAGVSLTITAVGADWLEVALIPHTLAVTTLGRLKAGDAVNIETDLIAKYVDRLLAYAKV